MSTENEIITNIRREIQPAFLKVEDQSERHRGHAGWREGGGTHFQVTISSEAFEGMTRIQRHRRIHEAISSPLMKRIHALSIRIIDV
ncbi:MAG: BolA family transcriptional regulator [Rhodobacteraceae bacterium]|nr:BolA family transcriptional regulator [Paracoccaceae bacterium]